VDTIAEKWQEAMKDLTKNTELIINADDPHLALIGKQVHATVSYFGLDDKTQYLPKMQHATDTIFCPSCKERLTFSGVYFSHLGDWKCTKCGFTHPKSTLTASHVTSPLEGVYNTYNTLAATLVLETVGVDKKQIEKSLKNFIPAFGRMEEVSYTGKNIRILLSKNPTGFNESLRTVLSSKSKGPLLLLLNDRIPDGTDVSWIWDVDMEQLDGYRHPIIVSGDRRLDLALRLKYAMGSNKQLNERSMEQFFESYDQLDEAVLKFTHVIRKSETGWILATYSSMLDVRKILTGRKIL
jgi:UDP-N-acetylmuramyl tripeptide synthase